MRKYILLTIILLIESCTTSKTKPSAFIPFDSMKVILWDLFRVDAYVSKYIKADSVKQKSIELYEKIFLIHKVDKPAFYKSCAYYLQNPDKHKILLDSIITMANRNKGTNTIKNDTGALKIKENKDSLFLKNSHHSTGKFRNDTSSIKNNNSNIKDSSQLKSKLFGIDKAQIKDSIDIKKKAKIKRKKSKSHIHI